MTKFSHHPGFTRRTFSRAAGSMLLWPSLLANAAANAQEFPGGKGIKLVCGSSPGSVSDIVGRIIAEQLQSELGVTVYVENKTGASGIIAAQSILASPADGHTIYVTTGAHTTAPLVNKTNYDPVGDFSGAAQWLQKAAQALPYDYDSHQALRRENAAGRHDDCAFREVGPGGTQMSPCR